MKDIVIYRSEDGKVQLDVNLSDDSVWLNQDQISRLFGTQRPAVTKHLGNIFKEKELNENSVCSIMEHTAADGKKYKTKYYNLDAVISIGYRVNSKRATQFRIWATDILKRHIIQGYTVNDKRLKEEKEKMKSLMESIEIMKKTLENQPLKIEDAKDLVRVIADYSLALNVLDGYDRETLTVKGTTRKEAYRITYDECIDIVAKMGEDFKTGLFGLQKDKSFDSSISTIYQTFDGKELYPSVEEKAANVLYLIVKNHSFTDGNKRIAAAIFLYFMSRNGLLYKTDGSKRLADNSIAALTLMIAESRPEEKDSMVKVVVNLINKNN